MGKCIIIKGADFSANGVDVVEYLLNVKELESIRDDVWTGDFYEDSIFFINPQSSYAGTTIKGIRLFINESVTVKIFRADYTEPLGFSNVNLVDTLSVVGDGSLKDIDFTNPISIESNQILGVAISGDGKIILSTTNTESEIYGTSQVLLGAGTPDSPTPSGTFTLNNAIMCNLYK